MEIFDGTYYMYNNKFLSLFGQWPYQTGLQKFTFQTASMVIVASFLVPTLCKAYEQRHNIDSVLLAMPSILFYTEFFLKYVFFNIKQDEMRCILDNIKNDFELQKRKTLQVLHDYSEEARRLNVIYGVYLSSVSIIYNISAWTPQLFDLLMPLNESRPKPIPRFVRYYVDSIDSNFNFIVLHGMIVDYYVVLYFIGFDTLLINCAQHACALFKIVIVTVEDSTIERVVNEMNLDETNASNDEDVSEKESNVDLQQDMFYRKIVKAIQIHKHTLEFVSMLDSAFTMINLCVIGVSLLTITLTELETVVHLDETGLMLRYVCFTIGEFVHILYFNWPGQTIKDHSLLVYQSCYDCEWYRENISNSSRQLFKLMMARSQMSSYLTAGNLYILGSENFAKILKASLSFFTVLLSMQ